MGSGMDSVELVPDQQDKVTKLRICVIGTSNAILKDGYITAIQAHPNVERLDNFSLGGSCSQAFAYHKRIIDFSKYDICLLDFCVNDTTMYSSGLQSAQDVEPVIAEAICTVRQSGCLPVLFMLPLRYLANGTIPKIYRDIAQKYRLSCFDGYEAIQMLLERDPSINRGSLFEDDFHINRWIARELALWLVDAVLSLTPIETTDSYIYTTPRHEYLDVISCFGSGFDISQRSTSLLTEDLRDMFSGEAHDIYLDNSAEIIGLIFDSANTMGILGLSGSHSLRVDLATFAFRGDGTSLILAVWPLPTPVKPINNVVRFNILYDVACDISLKHPIADERRHMRPRVGFCGLIIRHGSTTFKLQHDRYNPANLVTIPEGQVHLETIQTRLLELNAVPS